MKWFFRTYLYTFFAIWVAELLIPGFTINGGLLSHAIVALGMMGINLFVKPLVRLIVLPINIATLGLFTFVVNGALLWMLAYFMPEITISSWTFYRFEFLDYSIPTIEFGIIATYIVTAFSISGIMVFLHWIRK